MMDEKQKKLKQAIINYLCSEGCGCCESPSHKKDKEVIAKLLRIPKYKDGSGYDFYRFRKEP